MAGSSPRIAIASKRHGGSRPIIAQVPARGANETRALGSGDARHCAPIARRAAHPHFDKDQNATVARDQVDFAETGAEIARDDGKPVRGQKSRRQRLGACTVGAGRFDGAPEEPGAASGRSGRRVERDELTITVDAERGLADEAPVIERDVPGCAVEGERLGRFGVK